MRMGFHSSPAHPEGLQMFMVDRCLSSMSLAIFYSETGTVYLPLEIVLAIKFCPLLIFHTETENLMLLCISIPVSRTLLPFIFPRAPQKSTRKVAGQLLHPHVYIKSFNAGTQKWPVCTKRRCWLSQRPQCPRCIMQAIPIHQTVLQT